MARIYRILKTIIIVYEFLYLKTMQTNISVFVANLFDLMLLRYLNVM